MRDAVGLERFCFILVNNRELMRGLRLCNTNRDRHPVLRVPAVHA